MNSALKRNLIIGYSVSLFLLIVSSIASYISIDNLLFSQKWVNHTNVVIYKLESIISVLKDAESGQRGFLLTGNPDFLTAYNGAEAKALNTIEEVSVLTKDNPAQKQPIAALRNITEERFDILQKLIDTKRLGINATTEQIKQGNDYMNEARSLVQQMENREQILLIARTENLNKFASSTPTLIVVVSLLSFIITLISFFKVNSDFDKRIKLQKQLQQKDEEVTTRINIIQNIADKISSGNYKIRVDDKGKDVLGSLAFSLNKMAESLDYSFTNLSEKKWLQTGIAILNEKMIGEKNMEVLVYNIIDFITKYTESQLGAFYLLKDENTLSLYASIGLNKNKIKKEVAIGEGLAGQCALSQKKMMLEDISDDAFVINYSAGSIKPTSIIAIPVFYEKNLKGVIEIASIQPYSNAIYEFLRAAIFNIGMAVNSARDHQNLQELLSETQAQSEELQSQQIELENNNSELEAQSAKLQTSEEELRVQQEELLETNAELQERSRLLEEKNELILERNLDIQAKAEELAQSAKYKSEFLANMSHELRTPLNSILLLSRLLTENQTGNLSNEQVEYASVIKKSGDGLLSLIDEILDLSKIEAGKMKLEIKDVSIAEVCNELKALFNPMAKDKGIDFVIDIDKNLPKKIQTDRLRLEQILRNLISNALKFTAHGSVIMKIFKEANAINFTVTDTGIGIPTDKQQLVFEAFQQADGSTRRKYGGTGLGLSISSQLAKFLGGEITLYSEENKGSAFTLTLPLEKNEQQQQKKSSNYSKINVDEFEKLKDNISKEKFITNTIPSSIPDDRNEILADDKIILIIEDDTDFANLLLDYARQKKYKGIVAVRGDEGVQLAKQFIPTGILLDMQLPIKSGWEIIDELKTNLSTKNIPLHIMSAHDIKTKSFSKTVVDFINKPVSVEKLNEVFQKIEDALTHTPKKVLIVEENIKHAQALSYFLENHNIHSEIKNNIQESIKALKQNEVNCVIVNLGYPEKTTYDTLAEVKQTEGLENLPIIIFTGKNLSQPEEFQIKKYADSIVIKTAHSYQRILDEVSLFLHRVEEKTKGSGATNKKNTEYNEVLQGKTVLIADDDVRNIFSITKSLEMYGMKIISATDGKDALKQLEENAKINLILMDMMMPEMDGYDAIKRIRENLKYKDLPILAITAKAMTGDREKCISAGASDYITKPVDVDQLISLLRVWLYDN